MLANLEKQLSKLNKLDELDKLSGLEKSVNQLLTKFDTLEQNENKLTKQVQDLQKRVGDLESKDSSSPEISDKVVQAAELLNSCHFEQHALQMESQALADELSISGLDEAVDEDLKKTVQKLFILTDTAADVSKIKFVRRIGKPIEQNTRYAKQKQRDVLVKFTTKETADHIVSKMKNMIIPGNRLIEGDDVLSQPIRVHRRHPSALYKFRQQILKTYPKLIPKNVWIAGAAVYVRFSSGKPPLRLLPSSGMEVLKKNLQ